MELSCHLENKRILNGRYESVLSKLMKQTDTNIFCPTSDTNLNITTRIPKITISGSLAAVESARLSIRVQAIFILYFHSFTRVIHNVSFLLKGMCASRVCRQLSIG